MLLAAYLDRPGGDHAETSTGEMGRGDAFDLHAFGDGPLCEAIVFISGGSDCHLVVVAKEKEV